MTDRTCHYSFELDWPETLVDQLMATYWMARAGQMPKRTQDFLQQLVPDKNRREMVISELTSMRIDMQITDSEYSSKHKLLCWSSNDDLSVLPLALLLCAFMAERAAVTFQPISFSVNFIQMWNRGTYTEAWRIDAERVVCLVPQSLLGDYPEGALLHHFTMKDIGDSSRATFLLDRLAGGLATLK